MQLHTTLVCALAVAGNALPSPASAPDIAAQLKQSPAENSSSSTGPSCTFTGSDGYSAAMLRKTSCSTITLSSLTVPAGKTLNLEGLKTGTTVIFQGTTTFGHSEWTGPLFSVSGTRIVVKGEAGSVLDGQGALYWSKEPGAADIGKPKFFKAGHLIQSTLESITIRNAPKNSFSIVNSQALVLRDITIDNSAGDGIGKNTDGFNINDSNAISITGARVLNQDDCVAVNSGSNIVFDKGFCSGGHGLSIGSVGLGSNTPFVTNVTFSNSNIVKSQQSVRIKTVAGASGKVDGITYRNISISGGSDYGIIVTQSYNGVRGKPTGGVKITNVLMQDIHGSVDKKAVNVYVECGVGSCSNWTWKNVQVTGGATPAKCQNPPPGITC